MSHVLPFLGDQTMRACCEGSGYELTLVGTWELKVVDRSVEATCQECSKRWRITVNIEALDGVDDKGGPENGNNGRPTARE